MSKLVRVILKSGIEIVGFDTTDKLLKEQKTEFKKIQLVTNRPKLVKRYFDKSNATTSELLSNGEPRVVYLSNKYKEVEVAKQTTCHILECTIAKIENL